MGLMIFVDPISRIITRSSKLSFLNTLLYAKYNVWYINGLLVFYIYIYCIV